jgi:hypothetical protein
MGYKREGRGKRAVGVGLGVNVKWPHYRGRFRTVGGRGRLQQTEKGLAMQSPQCPDVLVRCAVDDLLTSCPRNGPSA